MRLADHRNNGALRLCSHRKFMNLAQALHAHFNHGILRCFIDAEQRVGHSDFIVLIAQRFHRTAES